MRQDLDHLRLLAIFHYVYGGLTALCACFPGFYVAMGIAMLGGAFDGQGKHPPPPEAVGWLFIMIGSAAIALGWGLAICLIFAGRCLQRQRGHTFCLVVAAISCINVPLGTVLGVFTLIVLLRPSVKELFGRGPIDMDPRELD